MFNVTRCNVIGEGQHHYRLVALNVQRIELSSSPHDILTFPPCPSVSSFLAWPLWLRNFPQHSAEDISTSLHGFPSKYFEVRAHGLHRPWIRCRSLWVAFR